VYFLCRSNSCGSGVECSSQYVASLSATSSYISIQLREEDTGKERIVPIIVNWMGGGAVEGGLLWGLRCRRIGTLNIVGELSSAIKDKFRQVHLSSGFIHFIQYLDEPRIQMHTVRL